MQKRPRIHSLPRDILFVALSLLLAASTPPIRTPAAQERGQGIKRPAESTPEQRLALVIGNADYKQAKLTNPTNDAREMAATLRAIGFEILSGEDRNQRQMKELIRQFGQKLRSGGVGVFYFAGHGVQVAGKNYLIPVGAEINSESEIEYEAIELGFVLAQLEEARNRLNIVILDACRNNPYARGFRSDVRGLASVRNAPSGTLIAYATAADDVASDGGGRNGLYTGELLAQIKKPGATLSQVFQRTRTSVKNKSNGKQVPYEYTSVEGDEDFYFISPSAPPPAISAEQQAWERVKQRRTLDVVRGFLNVYPDSPFEKEARALLAVLEKENPPVKANPPAVSTLSALTPVIALPRGVAPSALAVHRFTTASVDAKGKVEKFDGRPTQQYSEDLGNGVRLEMVAIKGGTFQRNASVTVSNFWIGKFELTQAQWRAVVGNNPSKFKGDNLPVETVSWEEAKEFCRILNAKLGLKDDEGYRLPTEAEWEYAARASSKTEFAFGDTITPDIVNYNGNHPTGGAPKGTYREKTVDVGSLGVANGWGLFDMHGNVWEWCEDWYGDYPKSATTDPRGPSAGSGRVIRGGGWDNYAVNCRSANRGSLAPGYRNDIVGVRLVRIGR